MYCFGRGAVRGEEENYGNALSEESEYIKYLSGWFGINCLRHLEAQLQNVIDNVWVVMRMCVRLARYVFVPSFRSRSSRSSFDLCTGYQIRCLVTSPYCHS